MANTTVWHGKLHHRTPGWVEAGSRFHIRLRVEGQQRALTDPALAPVLLQAAEHYHVKAAWYLWLFLLMPDHLHAVLSFPQEARMGRVIGNWKRYLTKATAVCWQDNYFDHRLRSGDAFVEKCQYIRMNPVRQGLCAQMDEWRWCLDVERIIQQE